MKLFVALNVVAVSVQKSEADLNAPLQLARLDYCFLLHHALPLLRLVKIIESEKRMQAKEDPRRLLKEAACGES